MLLCDCVYVYVYVYLPPPCSPSLSSSEVFQVDEVEAWQLMPPQEDQGAAPAGHKTGALAVQLMGLFGTRRRCGLRAAVVSVSVTAA